MHTIILVMRKDTPVRIVVTCWNKLASSDGYRNIEAMDMGTKTAGM